MSKQRKSLGAAKKNKNDEFYTDILDIEKEVKYYKAKFRNKIVFCNCDDPEESHFWKYFYLNFAHLGLKGLISTHYSDTEKTYKLEYDGKDIVKTMLKQNGDFRSPECIEILKNSNVVMTNPPFSLFREYVAQLIKYNKKFLIIGSQNAITYKEIFQLIKENKIWLGCRSGGFRFRVPNTYNTGNIVEENGQKYAKLGNITWYTNLSHRRRNEELLLYKTYEGNEQDYPRYDNYDAVEVSKTKDILLDYKGVMGVPISFLDKYNPEQFEIIGLGNGRENFTPTKDYINPKMVSKDGKITNGGAINRVLAIKVNEPPKGMCYVSDNLNEDEYLVAPYARVLIRHRNI